MTLLLVVLLFAVGQVVVIAADTALLWPLSPVRVYTQFPSDLGDGETNIVALMAGAETDAVRIGGVEYRMLRGFDQRLKKAKRAEEARPALQELLAYVRSANTGAMRIDGVRMYELTWDLAIGEVVHSEILHEYLEP